MGLGNRSAKKHETVRTAGVRAEDYWDFKPGQTVMTVDGFLGKVIAVNDGPFAGSEDYQVELHNGLGGGIYRSSQLRAAMDHSAAQENTASRDYPELAEVLVQRLDPGKYPSSTMSMFGSIQTDAAYYTVDELREIGRQAAAEAGMSAEELLRAQATQEPGLCENGHLSWDDNCAGCRNASEDANAMVVNEGDHKPQDVENVKNAGLISDWQSVPTDPYDYSQCTSRKDNPTYCNWHQSDHMETDGEPRTDIDGHGNKADYQVNVPECDLCDGHHDSLHHYSETEGDNGYREDESTLDGIPHDGARHASLHWGYQVVAAALTDPSLHFHVTAAWRDVQAKAKRIRAEGGVHITTAQNGYVIAQVKGDTGTYESVLMRVPGTQKVGQWDCGCKWATYHWGAPDDYSRFAGRMCSHALALNFEAQSRGMFGREVKTDRGVPRWLTQKDLERTAALDPGVFGEVSFVAHVAMLALAAGEAPETVQRMTASVNSPFGEPSPSEVPHYPATMPKNPNENPASAGFLTGSDPQAWNRAQTPGLDRMGSLDDALFEPEMAHTAGPAIALIPELMAGAEGAAAVGGAAEVAGGAGAAAGAGEAAGSAGGLGNMLKGVPKMPGMSMPGGGSDAGKDLHNQVQQDKASGEAAKDATDDAADQVLNGPQMFSTLHDEPEPALPFTDGAVEDDEDLFGPHMAAVGTGVEYSVPSDAGNSVGMDVTPGTDLKSDPTSLEPEDPSFVSTGSVGDIVAEFQRTAGAAALAASSGPQAASEGSGDIAAAAKQFLTGGGIPKEAMAVFTPAQQQELINEGESVKAANLDRLQIEGTHYEALDAALGSIDDDESWTD